MRALLENRPGIGMALSLLLCAAIARGNTAAPPVVPTALDTGFAELYNLNFDRAHAEFDRWMQEHPEDPLGPASHVSAYLLQELNRLRIVESQAKAGRQVASRPIARPDPRLRASFYEGVRHTIAKAEAHLAANPWHQDSLLALAIGYGIQADYLNLVERRPWASLPLFKKSNRYAQALLRVNPAAYDAWATSGFTEYLAGSLPFYARWLVRFDSVQGDKKRGIEQLRLAAARGRYLRPFAKIMLASVYLREKQPAEAALLLQELRAEFPANPLVTAELVGFNAHFIPGR